MNSENNNLAAIEPTKAQKIHSLPWALGAHTGNAIYTNLVLAGPVFMLFLAKLDLDETRISVILSIIPFLSVLSLIFGPLGAKFGYKRSFIYLWAIRKFVLISLVATPFLLANYGIDTVFVFIISVLALFALCNTAAVSWLEPWMHEFIPDTVRSKFSAISNITGVLASTLTLIAAGFYIGHKSEASEFIILFVIAFIIGLISVFFYLFVPGGEPKKQRQKQAKVDIRSLFRNKPFIRFLIGGAFLIAGWTAVNPGGFLILFLDQKMKFDPAQITFIVSTIMGVGLISSYLWGWAADRYGSKPIMLICLAFHGAFPLLLCLVQGNFKYSFYIVLGISALIGLGLPGWGISFSRYLYVNLVSPENRSQYLSFNLAFTGLVGGISPLIVGFILSITGRLNIAIGWFRFGHYTPLLIWSTLMIGIGFVILLKLPNDASVSTAKFVGMFTHGHPFLAMQAIYQHSRGGANERRLLTIKRLADARSPLAVDELLETLRDPSVVVRVRAIRSIASIRPEPRLIDALMEILRSERLETSSSAAWTLGLMKDRRAIPLLREKLDSNYPILRAAAAISLARLGDLDSAVVLLEKFQEDKVVRVAYGEALGILRYREAIVPMIEAMPEIEDDIKRQSLGYSVAMIVGNENVYLLLLRRMLKDLEEAKDEVQYLFQRLIPKITDNPEKVLQLYLEGLAFDRAGEFGRAAQLFREAADFIVKHRLKPDAWLVYNHALPHYASGGTGFRDFGLLITYAILAGVEITKARNNQPKAEHQ